MSEFRFKHFTVKNEDSPMKVGTDGVLLGAAVRLEGNERNIADVGTGTGVIALMLSQRLAGFSKDGESFPPIRITGIEIDAAAASEASFNFKRSPWSEMLEVRNCSLEEFATDAGEFDLIVSNPPYFDNSLQNPDIRRGEARHTVSLSYKEILLFASEHLSPEGRIAIILPSDYRDRLLREARSRGLYPNKILNICSTEGKKISRIIAEFGRKRPEFIQENHIIIRDRDGYSAEYLDLTREFYLFA